MRHSLTLLPPSSAAIVTKARAANGLKVFNEVHGTKYATLKELLDGHLGQTRATVEQLGQQAISAYNRTAAGSRGSVGVGEMTI